MLEKIYGSQTAPTLSEPTPTPMVQQSSGQHGVPADDLPHVDVVPESVRRNITEVPRKCSASRSISSTISVTGTDYMEIDKLRNEVSSLWNSALSERTLLAYKTAVKSFKTFMLLNNFTSSVQTLPIVSENVLLLYIAYCHKTLQIKHSTIKLYLSGIRFEYLKSGITCPLLGTDLARLRISTFLNAVKRNQDNSKRIRHPITDSVLSKICSVLCNGYISPYVDSLLKAVCVTSFFGFLRCAEITTHQRF